MLADGGNVFVKYKLPANLHLYPAVGKGDGQHFQGAGLDVQTRQQLRQGLFPGDGIILLALIRHRYLQAFRQLQLALRGAGHQAGSAVGEEYAALQFIHPDRGRVGYNIQCLRLHGGGETKQRQDKEGRQCCGNG